MPERKHIARHLYGPYASVADARPSALHGQLSHLKLEAWYATCSSSGRDLPASGTALLLIDVIYDLAFDGRIPTVAPSRGCPLRNVRAFRLLSLNTSVPDLTFILLFLRA
jgi:hypothetical protein